MPSAAETFSANAANEPGWRADQRLLDRGWLRVGAGGAVAAQAMVFSLAVNLSEVEDRWAYAVVHAILIASALGALAFLGGDLLRSAWAAARAGRMSIDLLFLVTLLGALGGSLVGTFTRAGAVYYEVIAVLIVVHTLGKMLGARSRMEALRAVDRTRQTFATCEVVGEDGAWRAARVAELSPGARVRVTPGGAIAVDGEIADGRGYVQETSMTGEWRPVSRGPGERVLAGTFSVDGTFEIRADGGLRKLDAILVEVERARAAPSRLQAQADRLMTWFLPVVLAASLGTFAWWWVHSPWERALFNAMAVLLVACPCAMGLATPIAVWGGLARLAKLGLVARTGDFLDALGRIDHVCLDKTGTLSTETLAVRSWRMDSAWAEATGRTETWLRAAVAAAEAGIAHPIAAALCVQSATGEAGAHAFIVRDRQVAPGRGVVARLTPRDGIGDAFTVAVGEAELISSSKKNALGHADITGKSVWVFVDDQPAARVELAETWRVGLDDLWRELHALGITAEVMSGDREAERMFTNRGAESRLQVRGGLAPAAKQARMNELVKAGRCVAFFGDGVNDAAAMSVAHVSVAMRGGAELARAVAMAVFAGDDWRFIPRAIRVARAARRGIRANLWFAASYNLAGMALAATGRLHPVAAALLMVGSSAWVAVRAMRSSRVE